MKKVTKEDLKLLRRDYSKWFENVEIDMRSDLKEFLEVDDDEIDEEDLDGVIEDFCTAVFPWNSLDVQEESENNLKECGYVED